MSTEQNASGSSLPSMRLDGQVALVTGASGGIGRLACCAFAEAGARVAAAGRDRAKLEETAEAVRARGAEVEIVVADVSEAGGPQAMAEQTLARFGRIDTLVNNAGIMLPKSFMDSTPEEWRRVIDVNLMAVAECCRAVIPAMVAQSAGSIIMTGSILSVRGVANRSAYCVSKAGVASLAKVLAFELGEHGITVNTIAPTVIETDLNRHLIQTQPQLYDGILRRTAIGRLGVPEDLAGLFVFLASPASRYVTGQVIGVDGGFLAS